MIFLELIIFLFSIIFISSSMSGYGKLINLKEKNFFLEIFLGLIITTLIITIVHFFLKINFWISLFVFISGVFFFLLKKNINFKKFIEKKNINYLIIICLLIPIYISQKYHEDFGYYHLPYAVSFIEEKIVFGFANINNAYVYNSIWLNLYSIFFLPNKNFDYLTLPSFILFLNFILFAFYQIFSKNKTLMSNYYLVVVLFYFILKFTRISEFGVDLPAATFSILAIYYFIKFSEVITIEIKKEYFYLISLFSIFSILIKLSTLPIILLPIFLYFKYFKDLKDTIFKLNYLLIYFLLIIFLIQQFIYTGCIFFPTNLTCLNVNWFNEDNINLSHKLELINKSYSLARDIYTPEEYLKNYNWLIFWAKRSYTEISEHFFTIIIPSLLFIFLIKKRKKNNLLLEDKSGLYIFLILGLLFWLNFSPVYRFAIHLFVTFVFIILLGQLSSKDISKKIFSVFTMIFIFFSFSKNILRLNNVENIFIGIQKMDNVYVLNKKNNNDIVKIYRPDIENNSQNGWQGRLCWDAPFICSSNALDVKKKNGYLLINKLNN